MDAEDEEDREAAAKLKTEMSSELQEFDESKPLDDVAPEAAADTDDPNSMLQQQLERLRGTSDRRGPLCWDALRAPAFLFFPVPRLSHPRPALAV